MISASQVVPLRGVPASRAQTEGTEQVAQYRLIALAIRSATGCSRVSRIRLIILEAAISQEHVSKKIRQRDRKKISVI
jgi:hypothetical protein